MFKDGKARGCGRIVGDVIANAFIVPKFTGKLQLLVVNPVAKKTLVVLDRIANKTKEALRPLILAGKLAIDIERATPEELAAACRTFERNFKEYAMYAEKVAGKSCSEKKMLESMGGINQAIGEGISAFDAAANNVAKTEGLSLKTVDKVFERITELETVLQEAEGLQALSDCVELKSLNCVIEKLRGTVPDKKFGLIENRVGGNAMKLLDALEEAEQQYELIRAMNADVTLIAKNTGISSEIIDQIKNHIFYAEHKLNDNIIGRFFADPDMAAAWQRLIKGNFVQSDLNLLQHELAEVAILQKFPEATAANIHAIAEKVYNWKDTV